MAEMLRDLKPASTNETYVQMPNLLRGAGMSTRLDSQNLTMFVAR